MNPFLLYWLFSLIFSVFLQETHLYLAITFVVLSTIESLTLW